MKKYIISSLLLFFTLILTSCELDNDVNAPVITGDRNVSFEVDSAEPDWTTLITVVDTEDGVITVDSSMVDTTNVDMSTIGFFTVSYLVDDSDGNTTGYIIVVEITETQVLNTPPVITGTSPVQYILNSSAPDWTTLITATDAEDGTIPILASMVNTTNVDMTTLGTFTVVYTVLDSDGASTSFTLTVEIIEDTTLVEPTLTLNGSATIDHELGSPYVDLGAVATDNHGNTTTVTMSGAVDVTTLGSYTLTYTSDFNGDTITRTVTVVDTTDPEYTPNNQSYTICPPDESTPDTSDGTGGLLVGGSIIGGPDPGAPAPVPCGEIAEIGIVNNLIGFRDNSNAELTITTVSSNVDLAVPGEYSITVDVTDSSGNTLTQTFSVTVEYPSESTMIGSSIVSPGTIGFKLQNTATDQYQNLKYTIEYFNTEKNNWMPLSGHQDIIVNSDLVNLDVTSIDMLYRMKLSYENPSNNVVSYSYSAPVSQLNMFLTSSLVVDGSMINLDLDLTTENIARLDSVIIRKPNSTDIVSTLSLEQLSNVSYEGFEENTDYILVVEFDGGHVFEFEFHTEEVVIADNNFPLTDTDMALMKTYIHTFVAEHYNTSITDEDFCTEHYYEDLMFNALSTVTTGHQMCTTYRSSALSIGGVYTLQHIEYLNYGYTEDGTQEYIFAATFYYNGGPGFEQYGYRVYTFNIVEDDTSINGYKEMDFFPTYTMIYTSPQLLDEYVYIWATDAVNASDINTYCEDRSYGVPFADCLETMSLIGDATLTGQTYTLTRQEGFYTVVTIELNLLDATSTPFKVYLPLAISQTLNEDTLVYDLDDVLYYQKNITEAEKDTIKQEYMTYLEDYFDQTMTLTEFLALYSDEYLKIDTYRTLDWTNNVDATFVDIVYHRYQPGFGPSYKIYYSNDGVTKETIIGYRLSDNSIRQPSYLLGIIPD